MGQSLTIASISTMMVKRAVSEIEVLPNTLYKLVLVIPISISQKPPYHGALLGINCHFVPKSSLRVGELSIF